MDADSRAPLEKAANPTGEGAHLHVRKLESCCHHKKWQGREEKAVKSSHHLSSPYSYTLSVLFPVLFHTLHHHLQVLTDLSKVLIWLCKFESGKEIYGSFSYSMKALTRCKTSQTTHQLRYLTEC